MGRIVQKVSRFPGWLVATGKAFKDMITDKKGTTVVPARVYWLLGALWSLGLSAWSVVVLQQPFNMTDFGTGFGAILVAGGAGVFMTHRTEPS